MDQSRWELLASFIRLDCASQVTHTEALNSQNSFYQVSSRQTTEVPQHARHSPAVCVHALLLHIWRHMYSETVDLGHLCPRVEVCEAVPSIHRPVSCCNRYINMCS